MISTSIVIITGLSGLFNLCLSIFYTLARIDSNEHDAQIGYAFFTTGSVNMTCAYLRRNRDDGLIGGAFTISLVISSLFNFATAFRAFRVRQSRGHNERGLPIHAAAVSKAGGLMCQTVT
ncbi:hypothetical protein B0H10DRAFT_1111886 [Mycena sp. CBHHK59/15]|nr:hypothetical protein B0H10DRAFT_1111886 [Mycena sp. CBHHK59/15]